MAILICLAAAVASPAGADAAPGGWSATGSLAVPRTDHTATRLPNGTVLVAGGKNAAGSPVSSAELFNPVTGTWSSTGALAAPRADHTATLLADGRVLVTGGETAASGGQEAILNSAEVYNPTAGTWTPTAPMTDLRTEHTATLLPDGKVLVAGGRAGTASYPSGAIVLIGDSFETYNPADNTWTPLCCLERARAEHTATLLPDGKILAAGRTAPNSHTAGLYASGSWSATGVLNIGRTNHTATLLSGSAAQCGTNCGKVLVAGGSGDNTAELYNSSDGIWRLTGALATARTHHTATPLPDGKVLVAGGSGVTSTELFNAALGTWSTAGGPLAKPRSRHTATLLSGTAAQCGSNCGKVLVAGGSGDNTAELYSPPTEDPPPDTTPPETTIDSGVAEGATTNDSTPTFAFSSSEPGTGSGFECRVDQAQFASCTSPHTTDPLPDGPHIFEVRAKDAAGNVDPTPARRTFTVDTTAPQTTIDSGVAEGATTNDSTPTFAFSSSEPGAGSGFECRVDQAPFASCTSPHTTGALPDGPHTFEVRAKDAAGNLDQTPATRAFRVDTSAPSLVPDDAAPAPAPPPGGAVVKPETPAPPSGNGKPPTRPSDPEAGRASALRSCLAAVDKHKKLEQRRTARGSRRQRPSARQHMTRHAKAGRQACLNLYARTPGRVTALSARVLSSTKIALTFLAPGTDGSRPPAARSYLVKHSRAAITSARSFTRAQSLCRGACRFTATQVGARLTLTIGGLRARGTYYFAIAARDNVSGRLGARSQTVKVKMA